MPITAEQARAELARRGIGPQPGRQPSGGITSQQARDELERRQLANPPVMSATEPEQPGILSRIGKTLYNASPLPIIDDIKDIASQGVERSESFPYFRLPESVGKRHEEMSQAARNMAPYAVPGVGGAVASGARGMLSRAAGAGAGQAVASAGQQGIEEGAIDPRQVATAAALGSAGQGVGEVASTAIPAAVRGLMRGGAQGRAGVQQAIADASAVGEVPTVAQATKNSFLDGLEASLTKIPGSAGRLRDHIAKTTANVRQGLEDIAQQSVPGDLDSVSAGQAVIDGVEGFVGRFQGRSKKLFDTVVAEVGQATPARVDNTMKAVRSLTAPVQGAEKTSERFVSPFIRGLADDLAADVADNGMMPVEALRRVRSLVGEKLGNPSLVSDVPRAQLKQLYGAISDDIGVAAKAAGPRAEKAFGLANQFYRTRLGHIERNLEPLVKNRAPEKVFDAIVSGGRSGPTQIKNVYKSLTNAQQDVVTGAVIKRMGTAPAGQQGADGAEFSFSTFLTRWNQMDSAARNAVFKRGRYAKLGEDINAIARYSERVKEASRAFFNPSGTSGATISSAAALFAGGSVLASPILGTGALTVPLILGAGAGGANVAARLMTSPKVVRWLAEATKVKPSGFATHIGRLSAIAKSEDPDVQEAIFGYLEGLQAPIESNENGQTVEPPAAGASQLQADPAGGVAELGEMLKAQQAATEAQTQAILEALNRSPQAQTLKIETAAPQAPPPDPPLQVPQAAAPPQDLDRMRQLEAAQQQAMQQMAEMTALNQQMQEAFQERIAAAEAQFQRSGEVEGSTPTDGPSGAPRVIKRRAAARRDDGGNLIGVDIEEEDEQGNRRQRSANVARDQFGRFVSLEQVG